MITRKRIALHIKRVFIYATLIFLSLLAIIPIYLVIVNITRSTAEINAGISLLPSTHLLDNWRGLNDNSGGLARGFANSFFLASTTAVLTTYFSAMTAYGLNMYRFAGRTLVWNVILVIMILPMSISLIGFFRLMSQLHFTDSYLPLLLPAIASPVTVFFIKQYLSSVPARELADVSRIDGAGEFRIFNEIVLPILVPALAIQAFFAFLGSWNSFFMPFILLSDKRLYTLPMLVQILNTQIYMINYGGVYLGIAVTIIPIVACFIFSSRFIVSGLTMGSLKE